MIRFTSAGVFTRVTSTTLNYYNDTVDPTTVVGTVSVDANGVVAAGYFSGTVGDVFKFKHASYSGLFRLKSTATAAEAFTEPTYRACTFVVANAYTTKDPEEVDIFAQDMDNPDTPAILLATGKSGDTLEIPLQTNVAKNYRIYPVANTAKGLAQAPIDVDNYEAIAISPTGGDSTYIWNWEAGATSDVTSPGVGYIGVSAASWASSTTMSISRVTSNGTNVIALLQQMTAGDTIRIQDCGDSSRWIRFTVLSDYTPQGVTHYSWSIIVHSGSSNTEPDDNSPCFVTISLNAGLASTTEVLTGTATDALVTPDALAALWEAGSDIASAGTISVGEGGQFNITGTTTITDIDFGTDKAGRTVWFKFAGALTLTHNGSTLILPTSANITTAANDIAAFRSEGSDVVRCISYQRASGIALVGILQDPIFTAKGDLPVGTGSAQGSILTVGANDYFLVPDSAASRGIKWISPAAAAVIIKTPRTMFDHYADETTPSTAADTLYTDTIAAATLTTNGDKLVGCYAGTTASNANEKIIDVSWGGVGFWSGTYEANIGEWHLDFIIIRVSNTVIRCSTRWVMGVDASYPNTNYTELTGLNLTTTGYALALNAETTALAGDVTAKLGYCQYIPAYA